jgi:uncharacterized repeat protein (TIGR01451 family)
MVLSWWRRWLGRLTRPARRTSRPVPRRRGARLLLETLEDRLTPATHTWTGASTSSPHWSDPGNWNGGAPQPGESNVVLNFGAQGALQKQNFDDIANLSVQQINFTDTGYFLTGTTFLTLTGGISDTSANSGTSPLPNNEVGIDLSLAGQDTVQVAGSGRTLVLSGTLTGTGGLTKVGPGTLDIGGGMNEGFAADSYTGPTQVNEGVLLLDKSQAVAGPLVVGDGVGGPNADQVFMRAFDATASNVAVTVTPSGELIVGDGQNSPSAQAIGSLDMTGGEVMGTPAFSSLPASVLTLTAGGVTSHPSATTARIDANLSLGGSTRTFDVASGGLQPDLLITGVISDAGPVFSSSGGGTSADLSVSKSAPNTVQIDQNLPYTITVTNLGPGAAQNVTLTDPLPANTTFSSESQQSGPTFNCSTPSVGQGGTVSCTTGTLAPNQSATFQVNVHVSASAAGGSTLTNTATVSSSTPDPNTGNNSSTATTTVQAQADLWVHETGPANTPISPQSLTYTLTVTNIGPTEATNVTLSDAVPSGTTFQSETHPAGWTRTDTTAVGGTGTLTWTINPLAAGASGTFQVVVQSGASGPAVTNTVTVSSPTSDPNPDNNTATLTTGSQAGVSVTKTGPGTVTAGTAVTYSITVTNSGPNAAENLTLSDSLPSDLLTLVSETQSPGHPVFTCSNTTTSVSCTANNLAAGAQATFQVVAQAHPNLAANSSVSNTATVTTTNANTGSPTSSTATATVATSADLSVNKFAPSTIPAGSNLTYSIEVANGGPSDAQNVTVTDAVPANTTFVSASGGGFTCTGPSTSSPAVQCTSQTVAANSTAFISLVVTVNSGTPNGTVITNTASAASSSTTDPNPQNNSGTATTTVAPAPSSGPTGSFPSQGGLTKVGAGLLMLTGDNTYVGPTTVDGGGLIVDGSQPGSRVEVEAGTLAGHGTLGPTTVLGGAIAPEETPGGAASVLVVMGDFTLGTGGTFVARITGGGNSQLRVTGTIALAGALDVGAGIPAGNGNPFTIIANVGHLPVQGNFAGLPEGGLLPAGGVCVHVTYTGNNANDVVLQGVGDAYLFVRGVYHGLELPLNEAEVERLVGVLEAGGMSEAVRRKVATDIWNSAEHRLAEINRFYTSFKESTGDGQFAKLLNALKATGGNEGAVLIKFLTSKPFIAAHRNRKQFVTLVLQVLTGKTPRGKDVRAGMRMLAQGKTGRILVVASLLSSKPVYTEALAENFASFFGRAIRPAEAGFFGPLLATGQVTPLALVLDVTSGSPNSNPSVPFDFATQFRDFLRKNCQEISQLPAS